MDLSITTLLAAFFAGVFATGIGAVWVFIACASSFMIGIITGTEAIGTYCFGPVLNPATTFLAAACVSGYANWRGYKGGACGAADAFALLKKPDCLLLGGVFGVIGWIVNGLFGQLGLAGFDTIAMAVVTVPMIVKIVLEKSMMGKVPEEVKAVGGRFSHLSSVCYYPGLRTGANKTIFGIGYGVTISLAMYFLVNGLGYTPGLASGIGFGLGGFLLLLPGVPGNHFVGCAACTALNLLSGGDAAFFTPDNLITIMVWGAGFGTFALYLADFFGDFWCNFGKTTIDIPASAIAGSTLVISLLVSVAGITSIVLPIVVLALCAVVGFLQDSKWKKFAAQKGLSI